MADADRLCTTCGNVGEPRKHTPGSLLIEIVMWCAFLVPGIIYTLWRRSAAHSVCRKCGGRELIPLNSPIARQFARNNPETSAAIARIEAPAVPSSAAAAAGRALGKAFGKMTRR